MRLARLSRSLRIGIAVGAAIGLLGFGVGATIASIPASGGTINACYSTTTGALRVIDYPRHHCSSGERFLRWNQTQVAGAVALLALQGTGCSSIGAAGRVYLDVAQGTGVVTITCKTVLKVQSSLTLSSIDLYTGPNGQPTTQLARECLDATSCAATMPYGLTAARVTLAADTDFYYTCPGSIRQGATPDVTRTLYQATCDGISMSSDRTVLVAPY
jgi:hypothetical protein